MYPKFYKVRCENESAQFPVGENESVLDCLEEVLYIMWELTPVKIEREWKRQFNREGIFSVSYHRCEFFTVSQDQDGEFNVVPYGPTDK
jgi:hypothetical protein